MPTQRVLRILALVGNNVREGLEQLEQVRGTVCSQKDLSDEERLFLEVALSNGAMMEELCAKLLKPDHHGYSFGHKVPLP